ncbi:hypothetical protein GCM10010293_30490 [Streptomyces griseoflavus]|nr:hypothetical protein GCM10010293_30490 [Streptomyces griseoflavus]
MTGSVSAQDDVAEFAALLRRLKERTDRSYGSLARRLNMNTSTLHRYCAGEAVPVDFAPVERFAALCGASDAERLDLHRHWLRALDARRRPRGTDGPAGARATTEAPAGPDRDLDTGSGPAAHSGPDSPPGPDDASDPDSHPGPGPHPSRDPHPGPDSHPSRDPHPRPTSHPRPDSRPGPGAPARSDSAIPGAAGPPSHRPGRAAEPGPESAVPRPGDPPAGGDVASGPPPHGVEGRRPWYRRRKRMAVALAAVCALMATVGSLSALPEDRETAAGRESPGAPAGPTATAPAAPPGSRASSPSPSPGSAVPSATPEGSPTSAGGRRASSAPPASEGRAPAGSPPLTWSADSHVWAYGCGHDYVVARPPGLVPPPPAPQDARTWAGTQAAVHGGETRVELSVQGTSRAAVVLTALRVRVTGRAAPASGNAYAMDQGCGGALTPRYFDVDLDKDRPIARAVAGNDSGTPIPAVRMPYSVSASDPEVLVVTARTARCDCRWYLELDWSSQGRTGTVRVDDRGLPFRTSGIGGLPHYEYDTSARGWRPRAK